MSEEGIFHFTSFQFEQDPPDVMIPYIEDGELFNQPHLLFLEETYMNGCSFFSRVVDKFKVKDFDGELLKYEQNQLIKVDDFSDEVALFKDVIDQNNISGLPKRDLIISIEHFKYYEQTPKVMFIQSLYVLLFISEKTIFENGEFIFSMKNDNQSVIKTIHFPNIEIVNLTKFYFWITEDKLNFSSRLKMVRNLIIKRQSFDLSDDDFTLISECHT